MARKHIPDVADSISLSGIAVESIPLFFFGLYFLTKKGWVGIVDSGVWLISCILLLINADNDVSEEERVAFTELSGLTQKYMSLDDVVAAQYSVIIAPQSKEQEEAARILLNQTQTQPFEGGIAFLAGDFHTSEYAEITCKEYRALGFFTVVLNH